MQNDLLMLGIVALLGPLVIVAGISFGLHYFIALQAQPSQRAAWTAGLAYLATVLIFLFVGVGGYEIGASIAALPSGVIAFWFWRREFRRAWLDDPELLPEGVKLANHDWHIGLGVVVMAVAAAAIKGWMRHP